MAEAVVSSIIEILAAFASENARQELQLVTGVETEVKKLQKNFKAIQCVLEDAEEKQFVDQNVKFWLDDLKEVSYDMQDVLDEWSIALSKFKLQKDEAECSDISKNLVCPFISCCNFGGQVTNRHDIGVKIRKINEQLDQIAERKDRYNFKKRKIRKPRRLEGTTSFTNVSEILGRDTTRDDILMKLLSKSTIGCIETISVVGMGGIGKTGLAQLVFDQVTHKKCFEKTVWICVSDFFDQMKIAREILEGLAGTPPNLQMSLEGLLREIREKIKTTTFFFVFDDVWTDDDKEWDALRAAFQCCEPSGGRILVTTRKESVADVMRSTEVIHLDLLPDQVCWNILKNVAFVGRESESRLFEDIGMKIAEKCKGLPLAAKTLGSLLRHKRTRVEWQNVLNSEFWELDTTEEYIFKPLLLSYYDLPSTIKRCLLYCAIFPKDYIMKKEEMILHWQMQGFLKFDKNTSKMELKGKEYFDHLASRSFFQDLQWDNHGNIVACKMHDLIHDFLLFMTKDEIVVKDVTFAKVLTLDSSSKRARHLKITVKERGNTFPKSINGVEKLRSLVITGNQFDISSEALWNLLKDAKCLRLLEIRGLLCDTSATLVEVPKEIGGLIHLRYLGFHNIKNLKLPESICELHSLQYLGLSDCMSLCKLPNKIDKLINLKYLFIAQQHLDHYPKEIGKLTGLRRLDGIVARIDYNDPREFSIGDLEKLDLLSGNLSLDIVGVSIDTEEAKRAKLQKKSHLVELSMKLKSEGKLTEEAIIDALKLPKSVRVQWRRW